MFILKTIKESARLLKDSKTIVKLGLMLAVSIIINVLAIQITPELRLTFNFLVFAICGTLFGPIASMVTFMVSDILSFIINSHGGAFFWGFTLNAGLSGLIYGFFLFRQKYSVWRCVLVKITESIFINMFLSTYWLHLLYGSDIWVLFGTRVLKNVLLLPIEIILLVAVLKYTRKHFAKEITSDII